MMPRIRFAVVIGALGSVAAGMKTRTARCEAPAVQRAQPEVGSGDPDEFHD
jgi:hypothetical protein